MSTPDAPPPRSAVVAAVPEVEPVVGVHRQRLDPSAAAGVPAHVTVLYPFVPPEEITPATIGALRAAIEGMPAFDCTFSQVRWFDDHVLWLAPDPDGPFRELTGRVAAAFPDQPPYGGRHPPVPHLTIGLGDAAVLPDMRTAAAVIETQLPVRARVEHLRLMAGGVEAMSWRTLDELALAR